ncbi:hypothetical protein [Streptomyces sp. S.PB5]|uniref:hypothetical protein n=1 Tax=Streptomyces sp. S.PB5 TaxID=3020844 RepID=UPI0025B22415|nr:hypothetical protein [Streptomyces sp. S.PB5]MDN3024760.1 hypothetical protein [Streptomyces sp. S.PB5]
MPSRPLKAAVAVAIAGALSLTAAPAQAAPEPDDQIFWAGLAKTYAATAEYAYEPFAEPDGYKRPDTCAELTGTGGMGYHYLNIDNVGQTDPVKPAALLHEADSTRERDLVAVQWIVENSGPGPAPTMSAVTFAPATPLPPPLDPKKTYYTLHAWLYKDNLEGLFEAWNPDVTCTPKAPTEPDRVPDLDYIDWTG